MDFETIWTSLESTLQGWVEWAAAHIPNLIVSLILGIAFYWLAKGVSRVVVRTLSHSDMQQSVRTLLGRLVQLGVLVVGLVVCLSVMDLGTAVTSLLAGAGVVGLALGFAFQDLAANFISGVGLSLKHPFVSGDIVETNSITGVAEEINLRTTTLRTFDGKRVRIPNKKIFEEVLINHSDAPLRRAEVTCGVSYGEDLDEVTRLVGSALEGVEGRADSKPPEVFFTGFGGSSIDFRAHVWFDYSAHNILAIHDRMVRSIKKVFDDNDITIPFPIRTLDFGIKGGTNLSDSLKGGLGGLGDPDAGDREAG